MPAKIDIEQDNEPDIAAEPDATETGPASPLPELGFRRPPARGEGTNSTTGENREPNAAVEAAASTPSPVARQPRVDLLDHQLVNSVTRHYSAEITSKLRHGAVDLYSSLSPKNASDSVLARLIVGLNNMTMDCLDRIHWGPDHAREVNLRYAAKGAATLVEVMKFYDARRGRAQQTVTVGKVKVEAGAQAIVGNVQTGGT